MNILRQKIAKLSVAISILSALLAFSLLINGVLVYKLNVSNSSNSSSASLQAVRQEVLDLIKSDYYSDVPSSDAIAKGEITGLVGSLDDPYSKYLPDDSAQNFQDAINEKYVGIGIRIDTTGDNVKIEQVFSNSPAEKAGLKAGDIITSINGKETSTIPKAEITDNIRGEKGSTVSLGISRNGTAVNAQVGGSTDSTEKITKDVVRDDVQMDLITYKKYGSVGVITISSFGEGLDALMSKIATTITLDRSIKEIAIDLRGNGGGYLNEALDVGSYFLPADTVFVKEKSKTDETIDKTKLKVFSLQKYPVTVLVDNDTASASEILAGALRDQKDAKLVGQTTYGKGVVQRVFTLQNGDSLKLTIAKWFTPKDIDINKKGLDPDTAISTDKDTLDEFLATKK